VKNLKGPYYCLLISIIYLIFTLIEVPALGQNNTATSKKSLKSSEIEDLVDLAKYNRTVKRLKSKKKNKSKDKKEGLKKVKDEDETEIQIPQSNFSFGGSPLLTGLLYLIIAALVVFLIVAIFSSIKVDKKIKNKERKKEEEIEDIEVIDAESGLEKALKSENYREAVRMLFIKLLQILVLEKSIEWKPEKTNRDYLREMKSNSKILHFNNLVIAYERIWYGRDFIDKLFFNYLREDFEKFYSTENLNINVEE
jgi:hypothetical protein